jgi:spore coat polysaccharide biosynthesis protein SpsF (cytidylyltransferase family)
LVKRLKKCVRSSGVTVVTTTETEDDALALYCNDHKIRVVRFDGDPMDVAGRFIFAAGDMEAVVRICADSPFVYPGTVDKAIYLWQHQRPERPSAVGRTGSTPLVTNIPNSGNSVEVVNIKMLKELHPEMTTEEKEHVTLALYNLPGVMRFTSPYDGITVDYPEDLQKYEDRLLEDAV